MKYLIFNFCVLCGQNNASIFNLGIFSGRKMCLVSAFKSQNRKFIVVFETDGKSKSQIKKKLKFLLKTNF